MLATIMVSGVLFHQKTCFRAVITSLNFLIWTGTQVKKRVTLSVRSSQDLILDMIGDTES